MLVERQGAFHFEDGIKYRFVQKNGENWVMHMGEDYTKNAHFRDKGANHGEFTWDDYKLTVWTEGR